LKALPKEEPKGFGAKLLTKLGITSEGTTSESLGRAIKAKQDALAEMQSE